jgi:CRISPR locus-related DNA-binding protein
MLGVISGGTTFFQHINVPIGDFIKAVKAIRRIIENESKENEVYVNLSGGMRALVLETYAATLLAKASGINVSFTDLELEGSAGTICLTPLFFPKKFNETKHKILVELSRSEKVRMHELSKILGLSVPTISRTLRELASEGLVKLSKEGKRVIAEISEQGKCFT